MTIIYQDPKPIEKPKRVVVLVSDGKRTAVNPEWDLTKKCCNCGGGGCVLCGFKGEYHD